jgi:hypothetical protein
MLNSGSAILAFSYARTVICPLNGTLLDIEDKGIFWAYDYKNGSDHKEALKETIKGIYCKFAGNYNELGNIGKKCREYVAEHNSLFQVSEKLKTVF